MGDRRSYQFGEFRLDGSGRILSLKGRTVQLAPKLAETLLLLIENAGNVVEKEELLRKVWAGEFVEEGSLTRTISLLRRELESDGGGREYIVTVPKRGYRFVAEVRVSETPEKQPREKAMLAVLPFANLSADPDQEYFSDGLTEEMIMQLGQLSPEKLGVIARTSAMQYKSSRKSVRRIGRELGVAYVLEGSVRRAGGRARITAQLIRVADQTHLWAHHYERGVGDILAIQSEVARAIATEIQIKLAPEAEARLERPLTVDPQAYEAYLRGRFFWNQRTLNTLQNSLWQFEKSIQRDPEYAPAYAGMADAYLSLQDSGYLQPRAAMAQARHWAAKAIAIDAALAEPHSSLGHAYFHEFQWAEAEKEFRRSLALNPNYLAAHFYYANYLVAIGRNEEAIAEAKKALALDPMSLLAQTNLASVSYRAGRYDEAMEELNRVLEIDPNYAHAHYLLGRAYGQKGRYREAIRSSRRAAGLEPRNTHYMGSLAHLYGVGGKRRKATQILGKIKRIMVEYYVPAYTVAIGYVGLGRKDEALAWMTKACKERSPEMPFFRLDPRLAPLRLEPLFRQILRRIGLNRSTEPFPE